MTIDSAYWPEKRANHGGTVYQFEFEIIDPAYIEIYAIDASDVYTLIDPADYDVTIGTFIAPISRGGRVTFDDPLGASVVAISIQRKTDIDDAQEFTTGQPFNAESFEFQCDKLTMKLQEINGSVCDCSDRIKRYCDVYACDAFVTKLAEIFDNVYPFTGGVAGNIGKDPVIGLSVSGTPNFFQPSLLSGSCPGVTCALGNSVEGWKNDNPGSTYSASMGGLFRVENSNAVNFLRYRLNAFGSNVNLGWAAGNYFVQINVADAGDSSPAYTIGNNSSARFIIINFSINSSTNYYELGIWVDFQYLGLFAGTIDISANLNLGDTKLNVHEINGLGSVYVQNVFWNPSGTITQAGVDALEYAFSQNNPSFVDPDPFCADP